MNESKQQLDQLAEIRSMMERSSKFISLSGFSGVWVGSMALIGLAAIYFNYTDYFMQRYGFTENIDTNYLFTFGEAIGFVKFVIIDAAIVLAAAVIGALFFTIRKSNSKGLSIWDNSAKRFLVSMAVPLITGGLFVLISIYHQQAILAGPLTLIFYGLALFNAGRYSLIEIRYLGLMEITLGLLAAIFIGYTGLFWGLGFGVLHIIYGVVMYLKHDR